MAHTKSESDMTSLAETSPSPSPPKRHSPPTSPPSPAKRPVYYVQSPSRDSRDGDKSSSMQTTPIFNSPMDSPSHLSYGRHSRASSGSRFSGPFRFSSSSGRKGGGGLGRKRNEKGWPECDVIQEEGSYDDLDAGISRRCQAFMALLVFVLLFSVFSLIIWGASRPYKAEIVAKSLRVDNFYFGEGSDFSGVPTKMLTVNCSLKISIYNPATFFGIHVASTPVNLMYSEIAVATGQLKKYYQPRKSRRTVLVTLEGSKVPLYGAGASLAVSDSAGGVPLRLEIRIRTQGNVVGKLVRTKHKKHITCPIVINSIKTKAIKFKEDSCSYN